MSKVLREDVAAELKAEVKVQEPTDPSDALLAVLKDLSKPEHERATAFEDTLLLESGWWGKGTLLTATAAYASFKTRQRLPSGCSVDQIDTEEIAVAATLELYRSAWKIEQSAKAWYRGVIRNLVSQEIKHQRPILIAREITDETKVSQEADADDTAAELSPVDAGNLDEERARVQAVVDALPPSLRLTARLLLVERFSRDEVREMLKIPAPLLRQRVKRITEAINRRLSTAKVKAPKPRGRKPPRAGRSNG